jgi:hypothetical protein
VLRTFRKILRCDGVELLDLLHDKLLLVDTDNKCGAAGVAPSKAKLAEGVLELLGNVDGARLGKRVHRAECDGEQCVLTSVVMAADEGCRRSTRE